MALTVGTDSYISEVDAAAYIALYADEGTSVTEANLRQATLALDRLYGARFAGVVADDEQPLQFPRYGSTLIPLAVEQATVELAILLNGGFNPYTQPNPTVTEETVKVDVIQTTKKYASAYASNVLHKVSLILSPVLLGRSIFGTAEVVRG